MSASGTVTRSGGPTSVVVVGAGIAGASCARELRRAGLAVRVVDRGSAPGGRMASPTVEGRAVDTGARYLTVRDDAFRAVVDDWDRRGLAHAWTATLHVASPGGGLTDVRDGPTRWSAAGGLRSLVVDLLGDTDVTSGREVEAVAVDGSGDGRPTVDGEPADAVVLAMPDPQAARLLDPVTLADVRTLVDGRAWTPQLALLAGWDRKGWADDLDGAFVHGSDVLSWVADDGRRRADAAPVLVAHSTPELAAQHLADPDGALTPMLDAVRALLSVDAEPRWARTSRWTYASPAEPHDEPFLLAPAGSGLLGACGDAWGGEPRVEQAFLSGRALGRELAARLG